MSSSYKIRCKTIVSRMFKCISLSIEYEIESKNISYFLHYLAGIYEKKIKFKPGDYPNCENQALQNAKKYYVRKSKKGVLEEVYDFLAVLNQADPAELKLAWGSAKKGGELIDVETSPGSKRCGIGTEITYLRISDPDVGKNGGYDVASPTLKVFEPNPFEESSHLTKLAQDYCKTVITQTVSPDVIQAGRGYLKAAIRANFEMMFIFKGVGTFDLTGFVMKIKEALEEYGATKEDGDDFLRKYGNLWFYCKCKLLKIRQCKRMKNEDEDERMKMKQK